MNGVSLVTVIKDIGWFLLIGLLLPLWMALSLAALAFMVTRQLYWWARGTMPAASSSVTAPVVATPEIVPVANP